MLYIPSPFSPTFSYRCASTCPAKVTHMYVYRQILLISPDITDVSVDLPYRRISAHICVYQQLYRLISMLLHIVHVQNHVQKKTKNNNIYRYMHNMSRKKWGKSSTKIGGKPSVIQAGAGYGGGGGRRQWGLVGRAFGAVREQVCVLPGVSS